MGAPAAIRAALAAQITANVLISGNIPALRGLTDAATVANPPVAIVLPAQGTYIDYEKSFEHGAYDITIRIVILVPKSSERAWLPVLDAYLAPSGASSVPAAILKDTTLGGATDYCVPVSATGPADIAWSSGIDYLAAEIICTAAAE